MEKMTPPLKIFGEVDAAIKTKTKFSKSTFFCS